MKLKEIQRSKGALLQSVIGLHNAKVGDIIEIGFEGSRVKIPSKIAKIVKNNRLQDEDGNIFDRNGIIYRRKSWVLKRTKGKIVSARHMTQKQLDQEMYNRKLKYINEIKWKELDEKRLDKVLEILRVTLGTIQGNKSYSS